jgi:hypothetical protein
MTEDEFFEQFENGTLDAKLFDHTAHVKMAWIYLQKDELPEALRSFSSALKRFARINGATGLYHETITFAFLILIQERKQLAENKQNWDDFYAANPDLFDWKTNILKKYYREETLKSRFAKKHFVFPDKF